MARHRSFGSEFKRQLAKEFLDGSGGMHERARRHSLSRNLIRLWIRKYEAGEFTDELAEAVHIAEYERKIAELWRKVGQLTMEVDLLKKGAQLGRQPNEGNYSVVSGPKPPPSHGVPKHAAGAFDLLLPRPRRAGEKNAPTERIHALCAEFLGDGYRRIARQLHVGGPDRQSQGGRAPDARKWPPSTPLRNAHHGQQP